MRGSTPPATAASAPSPTKGFVILTWNVEGLTTGTKELVLLDLLVTNNVSVAAITETEVPASHGTFDLAGYVSFLPQVEAGDKYRVIVYVRCDVALASDARLAVDIMRDGLQAVWVRLDAHRSRPAMIVGGIYRQWSKWSPGGVNRKMDMQREQLIVFLQQVEAAASSSRVLIVLGDVNLDAHRSVDKSYHMRQMLLDLKEGMAKSGLTYHETGKTYVSHGHYAPSAGALASAVATASCSASSSSPPSRVIKPQEAVKTPATSAAASASSSCSAPPASASSPSRAIKPQEAVKTPATSAATSASSSCSAPPASSSCSAPPASALWSAATWAAGPLAALWAAAPSPASLSCSAPQRPSKPQEAAKTPLPSSSVLWATSPPAAGTSAPPTASSSEMRDASPLTPNTSAPSATSSSLSGKRSRTSAIDHIYSAGISLDVRLLPDAATDHRPITATLSDGNVSKGKKIIARRNFKAVDSIGLCGALEEGCVWSDVYSIKGVDEALAFIMTGVGAALDVVAPVKSITVKEGDQLYLAADTRALMKLRDAAARGGRKHKKLRNDVTRLVRRDRVRSNVAKLAKSRGDPRTIWQIASSALGQSGGQLPASLRVASTPPTSSSSPMRDAPPPAAKDIMTTGDREAATLMNSFYISKVAKLKEGVSEAPPPRRPPGRRSRQRLPGNMPRLARSRRSSMAWAPRRRLAQTESRSASTRRGLRSSAGQSPIW
jgi:exonuclease III